MNVATVKTERNYGTGIATVRGVIWDKVTKEEVNQEWSLVVDTNTLPESQLRSLALYGLRAVNDAVNSDKNLTTIEEKLAAAQTMVQGFLDDTHSWERERKSADVVKVSASKVAQLTPEEQAMWAQIQAKIRK